MIFPDEDISKDVGTSLQQSIEENNHVDKTSCNRDEIWLRSNDVRNEQVTEVESQSDEIVEEVTNPTVFVTDCV